MLRNFNLTIKCVRSHNLRQLWTPLDERRKQANSNVAAQAKGSKGKPATFRAIPVLPEILKKIRLANAGLAPTSADRRQQLSRVAMARPSPVAEHFFGNTKARLRSRSSYQRVTKVEAMNPKDFPKGNLPEVCFAGRSNVGKSSLLNKVMGKEGFAATSLLPGETRTITFYCVQQALHLVDLPGYGFAHATEEKRQEWLALMRTYFSQRRQLRHVFVLVDAQNGIKPIDRDLLKFLNQHRVRFSLVLTKTDLVPEEDLARTIYLLRGEDELQHAVDPNAAWNPILVSAKIASGIARLKNMIVEYVPRTARSSTQPSPKGKGAASLKADGVVQGAKQPHSQGVSETSVPGKEKEETVKKNAPTPETELELQDQHIVKAMKKRKVQMKRLKRRKQQKRQLQKEEEARDPSLLAYRQLLKQQRKESGGKHVKRNVRRRLRLLSKIKAGTVRLKVPKTQGQLSLQGGDPYTESGEKHRTFQARGEHVHLFEETYRPEDIPKGQRRLIPPQEIGSTAKASNTVELRMDGGWEDTERLMKVKQELQSEAAKLREQAGVKKKERQGPKKGRWRDIPKSNSEEELYHPEPLSDRQYFHNWFSQRRKQRAQDVLRRNPYFLG